VAHHLIALFKPAFYSGCPAITRAGFYRVSCRDVFAYQEYGLSIVVPEQGGGGYLKCVFGLPEYELGIYPLAITK